jgi:hypothetical protein
MALLLSSHNVANYLKGLALCTDADQDKVQIDSIPAKSFNLLVTLSIAILNHSDKFVGVVPPCLPPIYRGNHGGIAPTIITQII